MAVAPRHVLQGVRADGRPEARRLRPAVVAPAAVRPAISPIRSASPQCWTTGDGRPRSFWRGAASPRPARQGRGPHRGVAGDAVVVERRPATVARAVFGSIPAPSTRCPRDSSRPPSSAPSLRPGSARPARRAPARRRAAGATPRSGHRLHRRGASCGDASSPTRRTVAPRIASDAAASQPMNPDPTTVTRPGVARCPDPLTVRRSAQPEDRRVGSAGHREPRRLRPGRDDQVPVRHAPAGEQHLPRDGIEPARGRAQLDVDVEGRYQSASSRASSSSDMPPRR